MSDKEGQSQGQLRGDCLSISGSRPAKTIGRQQREIKKHSSMRMIGNLLWWIFGGLEAAIGYFTGSLAMAITIVGIPVALQTFKIGLLCLWPFGAGVRETHSPVGCIRLPLNILWIIFGGLWACLMHIFFGVLLFITIIGIPFSKQHFKMAGLALAPFGKDVVLHL